MSLPQQSPHSVPPRPGCSMVCVYVYDDFDLHCLVPCSKFHTALRSQSASAELIATEVDGPAPKVPDTEVTEDLLLQSKQC